VVALVNCLFILVLNVWSFYIAYSISSGSFLCVNCKCLEILTQWVTGFRFLLPSSNFSGVFRGVKTVPKHFEMRILTRLHKGNTSSKSSYSSRSARTASQVSTVKEIRLLVVENIRASCWCKYCKWLKRHSSVIQCFDLWNSDCLLTMTYCLLHSRTRLYL
jgi:hypothetical protein